MDWREEYFQNPRLHKAISRLEKLGADIEYVRWLAELVRHADAFSKSPPIRRITVQLPPEPALSAAAELAKAQSGDFDVKVAALRAQLERGQWYASRHIDPGVRKSASENTEAQFRRLIVDAYIRVAIELAKNGKVDPAPDNLYAPNPKSPGSLALGTSNMISMLETRAASTKEPTPASAQSWQTVRYLGYIFSSRAERASKANEEK